MQEPSPLNPGLPEEQFTISACTRNILKRWSVVEQLETEDAASWRQTAADKLSRFRLWASNLGAYHDPNDKRSADYRVRAAPDVLARIVQLARDLSQYLDEISDILSGRQEGGIDHGLPAKDTHGYAEPKSELSELWLMIDDAVDSLMRVSVFIRAKANNNRNRFVRAALKSGKKSGSALPDTSYDKAHVRQKYPKLEQSEWFVDRLGAANTQRRQFLLYAQEHQSRIAYDESGAFASKSIFSRPTQAITQATTHVPSATTAGPSDQLDYYETTDAESNLSATTVGFGQDDDVVDVIPLHRVCKKGKAGICPYCQGAVMFTRRKGWRQHAFRDLMAYSCTFEHCESGLFESRIAWKNHELAEHRRDWQCSSCQQAFETRELVARHISAEHPSTEHGLLHAIITAASPQHEFAKLSDCPFCDHRHARSKLLHPESVTVQHEQTSYDPDVSIDVYQRHLSRHMEQLALFVVPPADNEDDSDAAEDDVVARDENGTEEEQDDEDEQSSQDSDPIISDAFSSPDYQTISSGGVFPDRVTYDSEAQPSISKANVDQTRPFVCSNCQRVYRTYSGLRIHQEVHSVKARRFRCTAEGCSAAFRYPKDLEKHASTHDPTVLWHCKEDGCDVVHVRRDRLLRHMRSKHAKPENPAEYVDKNRPALGSFPYFKPDPPGYVRQRNHFSPIYSGEPQDPTDSRHHALGLPERRNSLADSWPHSELLDPREDHRLTYQDLSRVHHVELDPPDFRHGGRPASPWPNNPPLDPMEIRGLSGGLQFKLDIPGLSRQAEDIPQTDQDPSDFQRYGLVPPGQKNPEVAEPTVWRPNPTEKDARGPLSRDD